MVSQPGVVCSDPLILAPPWYINPPSQRRSRSNNQCNSCRKAPHASAHLLADALGESDIDALGPNVIRELRSQGESFIAQFESMQLEILETRLRMLCTPSVSRRASESAATAAMNAADDVSRPIQQKYLAMAIAGLSVERRHAFRDFLEEFKASVNYLKLDNRFGMDEATALPDSGAALERACIDLQARYADALRRGGQ